MKANLISYLFFLVFFVGVFFLVLQAQPQPDSTYYYVQKTLQPAHHSDLLDAYVFFNKRQQTAVQHNDTLSQIYNLYMLALIELDLGVIVESEQTLAKKLHLLDATANKQVHQEDYLRAYILLGRIYRQLQHPEQSKSYYLLALHYSKSPSDSVIVLNNIGYMYKESGNANESAIFYYQKAYHIAIKNTDTLQYARVLNNWFTLEALKNAPHAMDSLLKAVSIRKKYKDSKGLYSSYQSLTGVYLNNNDRVKAKQFADSALQLAQNINSLSFLKDAYLLQLQLNDNRELIDFLKISDSIERLDRQQQNMYASLKYNVAKEREQTLASQLKQERERVQKQRYQALAALLVIVFVFVFYIYQIKYKKSKLQEIYKTENRISKKVHDEVANDVYRVMTMLQANEKDGGQILDNLEVIYSKTRDISRENSSIDLNVNSHFSELLSDLLLTYSNEECNVITKSSQEINWNLINDDKKRAVYRILQELLTNMKKHSRAGLVVIQFKQKGRKITVEYRDNGVGTLLQKKNGLDNVESRISVLNGQISYDTAPGKGFKVGFTI